MQERERTLLDEGVYEVGRGSRQVSVGLGDDDVVTRSSSIDEVTVLGLSIDAVEVGVEASEGLSGDVEIEISLINDPYGETSLRLSAANSPADDSVLLRGDGVATEDGALLVLESGHDLPVASAVDGRVVVGARGRAVVGVVGAPDGARRGGGAHVARAVQAAAARGLRRGWREASRASVRAPQADWPKTRKSSQSCNDTCKEECKRVSPCACGQGECKKKAKKQKKKSFLPRTTFASDRCARKVVPSVDGRTGEGSNTVLARVLEAHQRIRAHSVASSHLLRGSRLADLRGVDRHRRGGQRKERNHYNRLEHL